MAANLLYLHNFAAVMLQLLNNLSTGLIRIEP